METGSFSETLINFYQITRRYAIQGSDLHLFSFSFCSGLLFSNLGLSLFVLHLSQLLVPQSVTSACNFHNSATPLMLSRKPALVRTRQYFPCFIWYCKWFLCSRMDSLPSVDSVPLECPYSHLTDLTTKMGPIDCIKTSFSRLAFCDVQASKCLFHSHTAVHN